MTNLLVVPPPAPPSLMKRAPTLLTKALTGPKKPAGPWAGKVRDARRKLPES